MEIGVGGVKLEQHNLRDLLRIKDDDHRNNLNQSSSSNGNGGRSSSSGLTLLALLSEKIGPPPPAEEPLRNVHSSRTLYDIIREERMSGCGGGQSHTGRSWRQMRDKIRRRQGGTISSSSSAVPIQETNVLFNNQHDNRSVTTRRHSDRFDSLTNSAESAQPCVSTAPDVSHPTSHSNPISLTETASGSINRTTSPPTRRSVIENNRRDEESAERVEAAAENADQSRAAEQPARTSLMTLLAENDRQMGLKRSAYVMCEDLKEAAEEEDRGGGNAAEYNNCCVCMVRHKGAAFIPCGHTFCRTCCRELWVQRGNCPICNNYILEILDIF